MKNNTITINNGKNFVVIQIESLLAVQVENYISTFYIENGNEVSCVKSLKEILAKLPDCFMQISRNTIVNIEKIKLLCPPERKIVLISDDVFFYSFRNAKQIKMRLN